MEEILRQILAELKKSNDTPPAFMPPAEFAELTALPEKLIKIMVRQGQLPHIRPQKSRIHIDVAGGIEALRKYAGKTAEEIAMSMPVPFNILEKPKKRAARKSG